jgi:hypothetical protein
MQNKVYARTITTLLLSFSIQAHADCMNNNLGRVVCAPGQCTANAIGIVKCSKFIGGEAVQNAIGTVVCGKGSCAPNSIGTVYCSTVEFGGAAVDSIGQVKCYKGCEPGEESNCIDGT